MVYVNLTITGEIDEVVQAIRSLAPQYPAPALASPQVTMPAPLPEPIAEPEPALHRAAPISAAPPVVPEAETNADWTLEKATTLMNGITGDGSLVILYLAQRSPPEASHEQIKSDLGFTPRQLTNALISVGNRASRAGLPTPAITKRGNTLSIRNDLARAVAAHETDHTSTPQSNRSAEWFDFSR